MTIEEVIYNTPIVKDKGLLNSKDFLQVLAIKSSRLFKSILEEKKIPEAILILKDLEEAEELMSNEENLNFIRYIIGIKYSEIGLHHEKDEYLVKGIEKLQLIDEAKLNEELRLMYYQRYSRAILIHFSNVLDKQKNFLYTYDNIEPLLNSKYLLFKLYNLLLEQKINLTPEVESRIIADLVSVLIFLSRWNEPFFILGRRTVISKYKPAFISYLKAHTLNEIAHYTCCTIYSIMTYEIKKLIREAYSQNGIVVEWKKRLVTIEQEIDSIIKKNEFKLEEFENQETDQKKLLDSHEEYRKWILGNHFALCEHSMYCFCSLSEKDDLKIASNHKHTQISWVSQFETLLDKLKGEYNLARYFLFLAEHESKLNYVRSNEIEVYSNNTDLLNNSASDYLIQAFKSSYSILDKIARAVYLALDMKQKDIYFHNCWKKIRNTKADNSNRYLFSLYSIACDLSDTSKYSAFQEYKKWRNLIEHEFFFLVSNNISKTSPYYTSKEAVKVDEFREKTFYMLQLCRTAIFSFTFFIRHESKTKEEQGISDETC